MFDNDLYIEEGAKVSAEQLRSPNNSLSDISVIARCIFGEEDTIDGMHGIAQLIRNRWWAAQNECPIKGSGNWFGDLETIRDVVYALRPGSTTPEFNTMEVDGSLALKVCNPLAKQGADDETMATEADDEWTLWRCAVDLAMALVFHYDIWRSGNNPCESRVKTEGKAKKGGRKLGKDMKKKAFEGTNLGSELNACLLMKPVKKALNGLPGATYAGIHSVAAGKRFGITAVHFIRSQ